MFIIFCFSDVSLLSVWQTRDDFLGQVDVPLSHLPVSTRSLKTLGLCTVNCTLHLTFSYSKCSQQSLKETVMDSQASPAQGQGDASAVHGRDVLSVQKKFHDSKFASANAWKAKRLPELCNLFIILAEIEFFASSKSSVVIN